MLEMLLAQGYNSHILGTETHRMGYLDKMNNTEQLII